MVPTIIVLFLFISYSQQAISSSTLDIHTISTSKNKAINHGNVQAHGNLLERLLHESIHEKNISETIRRGGGRGGGGGAIGRGRNSGYKNGIYHPNRRSPLPYTTRGHRSEASLLMVPLNLCVEGFLLAFIFIFPFFNY